MVPLNKTKNKKKKKTQKLKKSLDKKKKKKKKKIPVGTRFSARADRTWGPLSLLCNGYRVFPGDKVCLGRAADHSPPSSAAVMEE